VRGWWAKREEGEEVGEEGEEVGEEGEEAGERERERERKRERERERERERGRWGIGIQLRRLIVVLGPLLEYVYDCSVWMAKSYIVLLEIRY